MESEISYALLCSRQVKGGLLSIIGACFFCPAQICVFVENAGNRRSAAAYGLLLLLVADSLDNFKVKGKKKRNGSCCQSCKASKYSQRVLE